MSCKCVFMLVTRAGSRLIKLNLYNDVAAEGQRQR